MLSERKKQILKFIVDHYVATAEPVGSRTISKFGLGLSPATIRNEMSDLEALGYLEQPHTSAGRIPSSKGYRFYVDSLKAPDINIINEKERAMIEHWYRVRVFKIDEVLQTTAKVLSKMTNSLSVVTASKEDIQTKLNYIKFLQLDNKRAILILVTDDGSVESCIVDIPEGISHDDLDEVALRITQRLHGFPLANIKSSIIKNVYHPILMDSGIPLGLVNLAKQSYEERVENKLYTGGTSQILKHPEFSNIERMRDLLKIFEERRLLYDILASEDSLGVQISIGTENKFSGIQDCSVVKATYNINGQYAGTLAILGPTRMEYAKVIAIINFLGSYLRKIL